MGRQAAREQERQGLAVDLALACPFTFGFWGAVQHLHGLAEIRAEPDVERVRQADHLAIAGEGAEWRRVEIGSDALLAPRHRVWAVDVDVRRGGERLLQLFA